QAGRRAGYGLRRDSKARRCRGHCHHIRDEGRRVRAIGPGILAAVQQPLGPLADCGAGAAEGDDNLGLVLEGPPIFGLLRRAKDMKLSRMIFCLLALTAPAFAASDDFPIQGLERRVEFWKKAFTQYGKDDVVIHDRIDVDLIYDVASDRDLKKKMRAVRDAFHEIRIKLKTPEKLGEAAQRIYMMLTNEGIPITVPVLQRLSLNIHTQRGVKERFRDGLIRSGRYVAPFQEILKDEGVPEELALLPLVESSYELVRSTAGAVGVWQFTQKTGKLYKLKVSGGVDERLDPAKSTRAAGRLLRANQHALGTWPLAITAYNHGLGGMVRAQRRLGGDLVKIIDKYDGPRFGYASMNFYSEFLAAMDVYANYQNCFGPLLLDKAAAELSNTTSIDTAAVKSPTRATSSKSTSSSKGRPGKYKVRSGDALFEIAQGYGTRVGDLMQNNNLDREAIYRGMELRLGWTSGFARQAFDGWSVAHIISFLSGMPITPEFSMTYANSTQSIANLNAIFTGSPDFAPRVQPTSNPNKRGADACHMFDVNAFALPAIGSPGLGSRNYLWVQGTSSNDMTVRKTFAIHERMGME